MRGHYYLYNTQHNTNLYLYSCCDCGFVSVVGLARVALFDEFTAYTEGFGCFGCKQILIKPDEFIFMGNALTLGRGKGLEQALAILSWVKKLD